MKTVEVLAQLAIEVAVKANIIDRLTQQAANHECVCSCEDEKDDPSD